MLLGYDDEIEILTGCYLDDLTGDLSEAYLCTPPNIAKLAIKVMADEVV